MLAFNFFVITNYLETSKEFLFFIRRFFILKLLVNFEMNSSHSLSFTSSSVNTILQVKCNKKIYIVRLCIKNKLYIYIYICTFYHLQRRF